MRHLTVHILLVGVVLPACQSQGTSLEPTASAAHGTRPVQERAGGTEPATSGKERTDRSPSRSPATAPKLIAQEGEYRFGIERKVWLADLAQPARDEGEDHWTVTNAGDAQQEISSRGFSFGNTERRDKIQWRRGNGFLRHRTLRVQRGDGSWEENRCDLDPPVLLWPSKIRSAWSSEYRCYGTHEYAHRTRVLREDLVSIGERSFKAIVIRTRITETLEGGTSRTILRTEWFSPELSMIVAWSEKEADPQGDSPRIELEGRLTDAPSLK